jgi:hypothetical protein
MRRTAVSPITTEKCAVVAAIKPHSLLTARPARAFFRLFSKGKPFNCFILGGFSGANTQRYIDLRKGVLRNAVELV